MLLPHKVDTILRKRYKLTNIVGHGGMGNVYRAEDMRLPGRLCAIKEIQPDPNDTPEAWAQAQQQFLKEASILAQLDHPNLPKVSDFFAEGERDYLVMDYVPGQDLKQILEESRQNGRPLTESQILTWAEQIMDALAYLHRQSPPVLHRDIKPANIKLTPDGRIKLVDFGLVKLMLPDDNRTITVVQGRGTALYTPLEQYGGDGGHTDARTDIYALGATIYHLLTGVPPPDAKARFLNPRSLQPMRTLKPQISAHVAEAVTWALEMHPDERPHSIEKFREVLVGRENRPGKRMGQTAENSLPDALKQNRLPALIALILFILAIIITIL
jgi:serine/threonine-protein kinase